jgi:hypothetical protein
MSFAFFSGNASTVVYSVLFILSLFAGGIIVTFYRVPAKKAQKIAEIAALGMVAFAAIAITFYYSN